ncbi:unnamed protein product [Oppiella nova]|uniref:GH18 domain-containing protein n=1 Tax=Oppiella nova TaxID=334625 RepID=A0A7R9MIT0_9ACAR|nr:unnamed protein product [Oppiella nova]CAG2176997.1 unnamed protein product [Oppiella nova]
MGANLDYVSIMTYDEAGAYEGHTGHHSKYTWCISATERYHSKGIPKEKCLMGVPFYGHTFKLQDKNKHGIGAPITGEGKTPHGEGDNAWYSEMCDLVKNKGWTKEDPDQGHDPISYHDLTWVGYDDPYAAYDKSKWVKDNGYGGIIVWEITQDDFEPKCCSKSYPMLRAINHVLLVTALVCLQVLSAVAKPKVICYWPNWRMDSGGDDKHTPENIDPTLCTHIHHAFHVLDQQHNVVKDSAGPQPDVYRRLNALKQRNPDVKIIVSMGGWGAPDNQYSQLVGNEGLRQGFIKNTIAYLHQYKFDGLDIDWEFPVCWQADCSKGPKSDKANYAKFLQVS